jgi:hypothetical protein
MEEIHRQARLAAVDGDIGRAIGRIGAEVGMRERRCGIQMSEVIGRVRIDGVARDVAVSVVVGREEQAGEAGVGRERWGRRQRARLRL